MDTNNSINQAIKAKFVEREVVYCVSGLIGELSGGIWPETTEYSSDLIPILSQDDYDTPVEYFISCMDRDDVQEVLKGYGFTVSDDEPIEDLREALWGHLEDGLLVEEFASDNSIEPETVEALEHWIVSDYLARKLEEKGEMITHDFMGLTIWGRSCSGQSIMMDGVISDICKDVEILEGQRYEWKV